MTARKAYSYSRFSSPQQATGFSLDRQFDNARAFAARHGWQLDETLIDRGLSGFTGANATVGELGRFLEMVRAGRVPMGSILIVENVDRLSRLPPGEASRIITDIVRTGVDVATTAPEQIYTARNIHDMGIWLPLQVAACLAHEESRKKSDRSRDNWARKRAAAVAGTKLGNVGPFRLELTADRQSWRVIETHASAVRVAFRLAVNGLGIARIAKRLNETHPDGPTGRGWFPNVVRQLLRPRTVLGEYTQATRTKCASGRERAVPTGTTVPNYYPAIVDEATYYRVQSALDGRRKTGGRRANWTNLFGGLLVDDHDGENMVVMVGGANGRAGTFRPGR